MSQKIAVFRFSALGDCILLLPALRELQEAKPDAEIYWIIEQNLLPLFEGLEGIHFIPVKKPRSLKDYWALRKVFAEYHFDILLAMQASLRSNLLYPFIKASRKIGFDNVRGRELHRFFVDEQIPYRQEHLLEGFLGFVAYLTGHSYENDFQPRWDLAVPEHAQQWLHDKITPGTNYLLINPAASKPERSCSASFYAQVINKLPKNMLVVLTGGPADWEQALAKQIETLCLQENKARAILNLVGETSLVQLAAVLKDARLMLAPDTGPIHLADALGTRTIGLYAVAPPMLTGPYQNQQWVVNKYPLALEKLLNKTPDAIKWGTRIHHADAMSFFEVDEVLALIDKALS